ncbi:hypothetical protein SAMN05421781_0344 [Marinococcus luteus]|uniref:Uncharacterized protein n=1 Tax=Marinococcus luteus TaxID=1122204 RepID=A0A1H2QJ00_9BACI|nr:hypothetical protein [Marinococcus luteus]SDW07187.1 hypothetical protein SAMN05421781_0344 [Marinococcus luteus]
MLMLTLMFIPFTFIGLVFLIRNATAISSLSLLRIVLLGAAAVACYIYTLWFSSSFTAFFLSFQVAIILNALFMLASILTNKEKNRR